MRARLRVEGKEIAKIEVGVEDRGGRYVFQET